MIDLTEAYGLTFSFPVADTIIGRCLREHGEFARVELELLSELMTGSENGDFLDIGANIGSICLPLARRYPGWRVICVEPQRRIFELLACNKVANRLTNVELFQVACGSQPGVVSFPDVGLGASTNFGQLGIGVPGTYATTPVLMRSLDELAGGDTKLVKIDVEGFEPEVLSGCAGLLSSTRPIFLIESNKGTEIQSRKAMRMLFEANYDMYWVFAPFVTAKPEKGPPPPAATIPGDFNILAMPKGAVPPWRLPRCEGPDAPRPGSLAELTYLRQFGF